MRSFLKKKLDYGRINRSLRLCEKYNIAIENQGFQENVQFIQAISGDKLTTFNQEFSERFAGQLVSNQIT
ncbi:DUF1949 domain-containing protein [Bisgaard Taxon 10/6]|uniref:DUF1949 domain-containing protein n=1 Tax=Exercitatus varius TaxID=67857 RepID=UPI00294B9742|nr:DUF1949 domain-containing protein [Exercitatus varius]MDG2955031.1 DUF1949 domain-containing protein [Exercitatus varius]